MQYNINIPQKAIIDNGFDSPVEIYDVKRKKNRMVSADIVTWTMLDFLFWFDKVERRKTLEIRGKTFFWINYAYLISQLPIAKLTKPMVKIHLEILAKLGLIELEQDEANNMYYAITSRCLMLKTSNPSGVVDSSSNGNTCVPMEHTLCSNGTYPLCSNGTYKNIKELKIKNKESSSSRSLAILESSRENKKSEEENFKDFQSKDLQVNNSAISKTEPSTSQNQDLHFVNAGEFVLNGDYNQQKWAKNQQNGINPSADTTPSVSNDFRANSVNSNNKAQEIEVIHLNPTANDIPFRQRPEPIPLNNLEYVDKRDTDRELDELYSIYPFGDRVTLARLKREYYMLRQQGIKFELIKAKLQEFKSYQERYRRKNGKIELEYFVHLKTFLADRMWEQDFLPPQNQATNDIGELKAQISALAKEYRKLAGEFYYDAFYLIHKRELQKGDFKKTMIRRGKELGIYTDDSEISILKYEVAYLQDLIDYTIEYLKTHDKVDEWDDNNPYD